MTLHEIRYGDDRIAFQVVPRPSRRTLGIEVHPDGCVRVLAPSGCTESTIFEKVSKRASWISHQLDGFSRYDRSQTPRHYVSGETHRYLGRRYRLRAVMNTNAGGPSIKLTRGEMLVVGAGKQNSRGIKDALKAWYVQRARGVYEAVLLDVFSTFERRGYDRPKIAVREMQSRWGSLSPSKRMTLNARLIETPRSCIEYVVVHELCHLVYRNHTPEFFKLLARLMPDWRARKQRLESALL